MSELAIPDISASALAGLGPLGALTAGPAKDAQAGNKLAQGVNDFESILLTRLLEEMRQTIDDGGMLDDGADKQVQDLFWMYLAQDLSAKGGLGICKDLYRQLARTDPPADQAGQLEVLR